MEDGFVESVETLQREKETVAKREPYHRPRVLEAGQIRTLKLSRGNNKGRSKRPKSESLHLNERCNSQQNLSLNARQQLGRQIIDHQLLISSEPCTRRTMRTHDSSAVTAASIPSTAPKVTGARSACQIPFPSSPIAHSPTAGILHTCRLRGELKSMYRPWDSSLVTLGRSTDRNGSQSTYGTTPRRIRVWHSMLAPAALETRDTIRPVSPQIPVALDGRGPEMTLAYETGIVNQRGRRQHNVPSRQDLKRTAPASRSEINQQTSISHLPNSRCCSDTAKDTAQFTSSEGQNNVGGETPFTVRTNHSESGTMTASEDEGYSSDGGSDFDGHETPLTSPCTSPMKGQLPASHGVIREGGLAQLDGPRDVFYDRQASEADHSAFETHRNITESTVQDALEQLGVNQTNLSELETTNHDRYFLSVERFSELSSDHDAYGTAVEVEGSDHEADEATPLISPSPAKGARGFPFPAPFSKTMPERLLSRMRHPSALLKHCEGLATPRQRQLMKGGARTPDRFVPLRTATPTKESLLLSNAAPKLSVSRKRTGRRSPPNDPFGPTPRRSLRLAEQYATIRTPPPARRLVGLRASLVSNAEPPSRRSASAGAVWSVGGITTTEGVASVTNGRGGRVTSGSSAPHYAADFLRRNSPSEEEVTHGRRLAFAMEIDQGARMLDHSLPSSPSSGSPTSANSKGDRVWRNGGWENKSSPLTRRFTQVFPRQAKFTC